VRVIRRGICRVVFLVSPGIGMRDKMEEGRVRAEALDGGTPVVVIILEARDGAHDPETALGMDR